MVKGFIRDTSVQYVKDQNVLNMKEFQKFFVRVVADDYMNEKKIKTIKGLIEELRELRGHRIPCDKTCRKYINDFYFGKSSGKSHLTYDALATKCCNALAVNRIMKLLPDTIYYPYYGKAFTDDIPMGVIFTDECCEKKLAEEFDAWQKFAFPDKPNIIAGMIVGIRCIQLFFNSSEDTEMFFEKFIEEFIEYKEDPASS